jgi:hypothetical protein
MQARRLIPHQAGAALVDVTFPQTDRGSRYPVTTYAIEVDYKVNRFALWLKTVFSFAYLARLRSSPASAFTSVVKGTAPRKLPSLPRT